MATFDDLRLRLWIWLAMRTLLLIDNGPSFFRYLRPSGAPARTPPHPAIRSIAIPAAHGTLDARICMPAAPTAAIVICHGIGDRLVYWQKVQGLLHQHNFGSLLFDYAGYGRSTGAISLPAFRQDTADAYAHMLHAVPAGTPVFLLGFSMGTGVAADAAAHLTPAPAGLILCQSFESLRAAATEVVRVPLLARLVPDAWRSIDTLAGLDLPLLLVHSDADELFPITHAHRLFRAANQQRTTLASPSGLRHNAAYLKPSLDYWQPILDFMQRTID